MTKGFACWDSSGVTVKNLQLAFWDLAIQHFDEIREKWRQFAPEDRSVEPEDEPAYSIDQFVEDAAVALVLAGTSVTILLGQNTKSNGKEVPAPKKAINQLFGSSKTQWDRFIERYDALRHFGEPKWGLINGIDEDIVRQDFESAQEIWIAVLTKNGRPIDDRFKKDFTFK
jgi:hypothetical protein